MGLTSSHLFGIEIKDMYVGLFILGFILFSYGGKVKPSHTIIKIQI